MVDAKARAAIESLLRATDDGSTPIIRRLARIQARAVLDETPTPPTLSEDLQVLRAAVKNLLPIGNDSLPSDRVIPIYVRMDELRALHTLAQESAS